MFEEFINILTIGDDIVNIRNKDGKKLCSIRSPQGHVWTNHKYVISWAWEHAFLIVQKVREYNLISRDTRCHCMVCKQDSIKPYYGYLWAHNIVLGFECGNKQCTMFNVKLPIILTFNLLQMPSDLLAEFWHPMLVESGKVNMIYWKDEKLTK